MGIIPDPTDGKGPSGVPLPMECFAQAPELSLVERIEQKRKTAEEHAERKEADDWYNEFFPRAVERELSDIAERGLRNNQETLTLSFEETFAPELAARRAKMQPNPIVAELYRLDIARAQHWCASMEVPYPMSGTPVAMFLFEMAEGTRETIERAAIDRAKRMARAIEWGHQSNGHFFDPLPVAVMLEFLEQLVTKETPDAK